MTAKTDLQPVISGLITVTVGITSTGVPLYTIHGAKGKEWKYVFVVNVVDKHLPLYHIKPCDPDEELRLFYVAITRFRKRLYVIEAPTFKTIFTKKSDSNGKKKVPSILKESSPFTERYLEHFRVVGAN